jgi:DNA mismatch endonuclease (patch repair protein)
MSKTRGRDTAAEVRVRRELHRRGFRYRVNTRPDPALRRTGDIVFPKARLVVFIDGCFWHRCPIHYAAPKTRSDFWTTKIAGNVARDTDTTLRLQQAGWTVLRFWEHEDVRDVVASIAAALGRPAGPQGP